MLAHSRSLHAVLYARMKNPNLVRVCVCARDDATWLTVRSTVAFLPCCFLSLEIQPSRDPSPPSPRLIASFHSLISLRGRDGRTFVQETPVFRRCDLLDLRFNPHRI